MNAFLSKNKVLFLIICFLISTFMFSPIIVCDAAEDLTKTPCKFCPAGTTHDLTQLSGFEKTVWEMNDLVYAAELVEENPDNGSTSLFDALKFDVSSGSFADLWQDAETYYNNLVFVGVGLAMVYSLMETLSHLSKDTLTPEYFVKEFMKLCFAILMITNGFDIITALLDLSTGVTLIFYDSYATGTGNPSNCLWSSFTSSESFWDWITGPFSTLGTMLGLLIPWLIMTIAKIVVATVCWSRILEIITRVIIAPIGMADLFVYGANSNAVKYLKKMLVAAVQGAVILAMLLAYRIITTNAGSGAGQWIAAVMMAIVLLTSINGAKSIASDVCGV